MGPSRDTEYDEGVSGQTCTMTWRSMLGDVGDVWLRKHMSRPNLGNCGDYFAVSLVCTRLPTRIHSDQGRSFEGALIQNLRKCKLYATKKSRTTALHPNGNGQCEHSNKTLWLVTFCRSKGEETMARINQTCTAHPQLYSSHGNWSDAISFDVWPRALVSNWAPVE